MKNNFALLSCAFLRVSEINLFLKNFFLVIYIAFCRKLLVPGLCPFFFLGRLFSVCFSSLL